MNQLLSRLTVANADCGVILSAMTVKRHTPRSFSLLPSAVITLSFDSISGFG